ncbi:MAG TPA: adenine methyltransferase [Candidatus Pacearchaeota archaeon]|nr:adenine methyltransferase [Candidatus Pacearchaeota archaeon]
MKSSHVGFKSLRQDWKTPKEFLKKLEKEFGKLFDPYPSKNYTNGGNLNGLECDWKKRNFVNPPYTSKEQDLWIKKGFEEWKKGKLVIFLIPARTDTKRFHDYILPLHKRGHCDIRFIKGRLKFSDHKNPAPFPSMVCILKPIKKVKVKK